jgi:cytochrome c
MLLSVAKRQHPSAEHGASHGVEIIEERQRAPLSVVECPINTSAHIAACSLILAAIAVGATSAATQPSASPGELAFNNHCRTCHSAKPGDNRQGPSLHSVVGAKAGSSDYPYSDSMKNAGITWDPSTLDQFIANPDQVVPNNKMKPYTGLTDQNVRKQIIDYLQSQEKGQ